MKTTVLKASKKLAEEIATKLLSYRSPNKKPIFKRTEITNGFEISGKRQGVMEVVFRYINDNGRQQIDYNEQLLTLD